MFNFSIFQDFLSWPDFFVDGLGSGTPSAVILDVSIWIQFKKSRTYREFNFWIKKYSQKTKPKKILKSRTYREFDFWLKLFQHFFWGKKLSPRMYMLIWYLIFGVSKIKSKLNPRRYTSIWCLIFQFSRISSPGQIFCGWAGIWDPLSSAPGWVGLLSY